MTPAAAESELWNRAWMRNAPSWACHTSPFDHDAFNTSPPPSDIAYRRLPPTVNAESTPALGSKIDQ